MNIFRNMKTSTKQFLFTVFLSSFTIGVTLYACFGLREITHLAKQMYEEELLGVAAADDFYVAFLLSVRAEKDLIWSTSEKDVHKYQTVYLEKRQDMLQKLDALTSFFWTEEGKRLLAELKSRFSRWLEAHDEAARLGNTADPGQKASAIEISTTKGRDARRVIEEQIAPLRQWKKDRALQEKQQIEESYRTIVRTVVAPCVASVLLGLALGLLLSRSLKRQLGNEPAVLSSIAQRLADGDFSVQFDPAQSDTGVYGAVKRMAETIKNRVGFAEGVLHGITAPCSVADGKGKILYVNQQIINYIERDGKPEKYVGMSLGEFYYNDPARKTLTEEVASQRKAISRLGVEVRTINGRSLLCNLDAAPITDLDGNIIGAFTIVTDLTELVAQQRAAKAATAQGTLHAAERIEGVVEIITSASEELSAQVGQSSRGAEEQSHRAGEAAAAMEEMNSTVMEVAKNASNAAEISDQAKAKAKEGADLVGKVDGFIRQVHFAAKQSLEDMGTLGKKADGIGNVLNVISDIADQTNLLALNAAIEAARAGEAGRGFAVVADEVRKLAEKTMLATKEVGEAIQDIQLATKNNYQTVEQAVVAIGEITELASKSSATLTHIVSLSVQTAGMINSIAAASEQQSATSEEINRAVEDVNRISSETSDAMRQSSQAVGELARQSQMLRALVDEMKAGSEDGSVGRAVPSNKPRHALALS